jgi:autotransporter translocation and assembly factor TamB
MVSPRRLLRILGFGVAVVVGLIILTVFGGRIALTTTWGQERIRQLIVSQSNRFLTGTLEVDRISGSILRGVVLHGVRLVQDGVPVVAIDTASVEYGWRELYRDANGGTTVQLLRLHGLRLTGAKGADGRWNLARLIKPRPPRSPGALPPRLITFERIEIVDSTLEFRDPVLFGAVRVPAQFDDVNAELRFDWRGSTWRVELDKASWIGRDPALTIARLSGGIATDDQGWTFDGLRVATPRSAFTFGGAVRRQPGPTTLDLDVKADRFAFQEWSGIVPGLRNIAVESSFRTKLLGPLNQMATTLDVQSDGGAIVGALVLDSSVPGWHGSGEVDVTRVDLSRWFNRPDRPSTITGHVMFDLDLDLGRRFPRGSFAFNGPHAAYLGYAADRVRAHGTLTSREAVIAAATATAYGADVRVRSGAIEIEAPFRYRFAGRADGIDLRRVPAEVPVPHVESMLALDFDVHGQFAPGQFSGDAIFDRSEFLGAQISAGTVGSFDASTRPVRYAGEGEIARVSVQRFGEGLGVAWMRDPRYDGRLDGRFRVTGTGTTAATMTLEAGGRVTRGEFFQGTLSDADVAVRIADASLRASYDGRFEGIDVARALADGRLASSLSGTGRVTVTASELLTRATTLADYTVDAHATLTSSRVRAIALEQAAIAAHLSDRLLRIDRLEVRGPAVQASGQGTVALDGSPASSFEYDIQGGELSFLGEMVGRPMTGALVSQGRLTGVLEVPRVTGNARLSRAVIGGVEILTGGFDYDATIPVDAPLDAVAQLSGAWGPLAVGDQAINQITGAATYDRRAVTLDVRGTRAGGLNATLDGRLRLDADGRGADVAALRLQIEDAPWRLAEGALPRLSWDATGVTVRDLVLTDDTTGRQQLAVSGDWRPTVPDAGLRIQARGVYLDPIAGLFSDPPRYGGLLDADATIRPSADEGRVMVTGSLTILEGRVQRLTYDSLKATLEYDAGRFEVDGRLDQAPGVWLTARGTVPLGLLVPEEPDLPMNLALASSSVELGILEGLTDTVREVSGELQLDVTVIGTARDPHFVGTVAISNGGFTVAVTGARYRQARVFLDLATDQVNVTALHVEDADGHALDLTGSLGTHELRVGDLAVNVRARQFEVMRNEFGTTDVDADLDLRGQFESPRLTGTITITGGDLSVDEILDRVLLRPYATQAASEPVAEPAVSPAIPVDPLAVLNPWQRMGIDLAVYSRGTLHMVGENVQVSAGTPLGLGNVNVRAFGEIYLYKAPAQPLFVTGSFDSLIGTYSFQGRRFDLDPASSIVFRGDLNPELYVTVARTISGVETRVSIVGPLNEPALQLASTPPLDDSNILSLIVFNTNVNELNAVQQQELAVRAGTLAAGFLATPLVSALERTLGLQILEIELAPTGAAGAATAAPRVTIGDEIAPGLVARFSRQFGAQEYSEASIEYFLSRLFRVRATFSDAGSSLARSPFRRVERAGIDFLVFFSF